MEHSINTKAIAPAGRGQRAEKALGESGEGGNVWPILCVLVGVPGISAVWEVIVVVPFACDVEEDAGGGALVGGAVVLRAEREVRCLEHVETIREITAGSITEGIGGERERWVGVITTTASATETTQQLTNETISLAGTLISIRAPAVALLATSVNLASHGQHHSQQNKKGLHSREV